MVLSLPETAFFTQAKSWLVEAFPKAGMAMLGPRLRAVAQEAGLHPLGMIGIQPYFGSGDPFGTAYLVEFIRAAAPLIVVADPEETVSLPGRAGLAANQIGVSFHVFAYNVDGRIAYLVNPVIETIEGEQEDEEGCCAVHRAKVADVSEPASSFAPFRSLPVITKRCGVGEPGLDRTGLGHIAAVSGGG